LVVANASEYRRTAPDEHSEPAASGPTDPDRVTMCPATTGTGLTWTTTGGVAGAAHAGAAKEREHGDGGGEQNSGDDADWSHSDLPR
jgi:hypothetical protein